MKVKFTRDYTTEEAEPKSYKEGQVLELSVASAQHFIRRGAAVAHSESEAKTSVTKAK